MSLPKGTNVRKERKKAFLLQELSYLILQLSFDEKRLSKVYPTRVDLSDGGGMCTLYFASSEGRDGYDEALQVLILYRNSIKSAIAKMRNWRKMPDIRFMYDDGFAKAVRINDLIDSVVSETKF